MSLNEHLLALLDPSLVDPIVADELHRVFARENKLIRGESVRHISTFYVPLNRAINPILAGDHRKSGLVLLPGGHVEQGETPLEAAARERNEETGKERTDPLTLFFISITHIENPAQHKRCKIHYDFWYLWETYEQNILLDPKEFSSSKWWEIDELIRESTTKSDSGVIRGLERLKSLMI